MFLTGNYVTKPFSSFCRVMRKSHKECYESLYPPNFKNATGLLSRKGTSNV